MVAGVVGVAVVGVGVDGGVVVVIIDATVVDGTADAAGGEAAIGRLLGRNIELVIIPSSSIPWSILMFCVMGTRNVRDSSTTRN